MDKNNKEILINTDSKVNNNYLYWIKYQGSSFQGLYPNFTTNPLNCVNNQIIRYKLTIQINSNSPNKIYNINVVDPLSPNLSFISGSFSGSYYYPQSTEITSLYGNAKFNPTQSTVVDGKTLGGTIEWNIPILAPNDTTIVREASLYFHCEVVYKFTKISSFTN